MSNKHNHIIKSKNDFLFSNNKSVINLDTQYKNIDFSTAPQVLVSGTPLSTQTLSTTDELSEGTTNLYYTDARVQTKVDADNTLLRSSNQTATHIPYYDVGDISNSSSLTFDSSNEILASNNIDTHRVHIYRSGDLGFKRDTAIQVTGNDGDDQSCLYFEWADNQVSANDVTLRYKVDVNDYFGRSQSYDWSGDVKTCITSDVPTRAGIGCFLPTLTVGDISAYTGTELLYVNGDVNISGGTYRINGTTIDTDDIAEGTTNLYHTTLRTQNVIDADTTLVRTSGSQTIAGLKSFSNNMHMTGSSPSLYIYPSNAAGTHFRFHHIGTHAYIDNKTDPLGGNINFRNDSTTTHTMSGNGDFNITGDYKYNGSQLSTDSIAEGATNLYYTDTRVQTKVDSDTALVRTTGNQTVDGEKYFLDMIQCPYMEILPTLSAEPALKIEAGTGGNVSLLIDGLDSYVQYRNSYTDSDGVREFRHGLNGIKEFDIWYGLQSSVNDIQYTSTPDPWGNYNSINDLLRFTPTAGFGVGGRSLGYAVTIWGRSHDGFSMYASDSYATSGGYYSITGGWMSSDRRIKTEIEEVPDHLALQMVKDIPCKYYKYKDYKSRGDEKTIGFIAQEVADVFPMAVEKKSMVQPNIYKELNGGWTLINKKHILTPTNIECKNGVKYGFRCGDNEEQYIEEFCEDNKFVFEKKFNKIFCVGHAVEDHHVLNKDKIFSLHHSAIQELVKQIETLTARVRQLEQK